MIIVVLFSLWLWKKRLHNTRFAYITKYKFSDALIQRFHEKNPNIDAKDVNLITQAMKDYFIITLNAEGKMVAMPSKVVDEFWHTFILFTRQYHAFCKHSFGKFLHHAPTEVMNSHIIASESMKLAWRLACQQQNIDDAVSLFLPLLFEIDEKLNIQNGQKYKLDSFCYTRKKKSNDNGGNSGCGSSYTSGGYDKEGSCGGGGCGGD